MRRTPRLPAALAVRGLRAGAAIAVIAGIGGILTAGNALPPTAIGANTQIVSAGVLAPSVCGALSLHATVGGSGAFSGGGSAELIAGGAGADTITALGGGDCVLGGGGDDEIDGGPGSDVCVGGPGADTFIDCETQLQ